MTRINTNIASLRGLRNTQNANKLLNQSLQRLSTGLQINNGKDNPAGLIASESLRLQVTTIEQSIKNSNRANNVISTADSALGEIGGLLNQIRGLVQEGLNVGALSQDETEANQSQIDAALSAINRISANTTFAGDKLIDGSKAFNTTLTTADAAKLSDYQVNEAVFGTQSSIAVNATVNTAAEKAQLRYSGGNLSSATTLEIGGAGGRQTISLGASSTVTDIRNAINAVSDNTGVTATVLNGYTLSKAAIGDSVQIGTGNAGLVFTDKTAGSDATVGRQVFVRFVDPGANNSPLSVSVSTPSGNDKLITVNLATNGSGTITSTASDIATAIAGNATANALVSVSQVGNGSGVVSAVAQTGLTGGADAGTLNLYDNRAIGSAGNLNIVLADPGSANQALSVAVSGSTITVNLATDANSRITSTLAQVAAAINADSSASALAFAQASGDTANKATAVASTAFNAANGAIALQSQNYGSDQFVDVTVLSGAFNTFAADNTTSARRDNGTDIGVTINGQQAVGHGLRASVRTGSLDASMTFKSANNVASTTASLTITGGGSLFQIGQEANVAGQIGVGIEAVNTARLGGLTGKLYELGSGGGKSLVDLRNGIVGGGPRINSADLVNIIDEALNRVSTLRGRLGALQKNVIDTNVSTLGVALENISDARSQIVDTDFATETANLQKAQVLSQAGISVLTIANQVPQQVLALLR